MPPGRRRKYLGGVTRRSFSLPPAIAEVLDHLPNASEFVTQAVTEKLMGTEGDTLAYELTEARAKMIMYKSAALEEEKKLVKLEERAEKRTEKKLNFAESRFRVLEIQGKVKRTPAALRNFLESRWDLLAECDWKTAEEGAAWIEENAKKVVR